MYTTGSVGCKPLEGKLSLGSQRRRASVDEELTTAAARLTRRQDEDSFTAAARVVVRIFIALHGREMLATILPRCERSDGKKGAETTTTSGTTERG